VQDNGSGGLTLGNGTVVGVVGNTISRNVGNGLSLNLQVMGYGSGIGYYGGGESGSGITGNVISDNSGAGVRVQGNEPSVLTICTNDIFQNYLFELRKDSSIPMSPTTLAIPQFYGYFMITVNGTVGSSYRLEAASDPAGPWEPLVIMTLTSSPWSYVDWESAGQTKRFYRTVLLE
jgi:hypothetical protein